MKKRMIAGLMAVLMTMSLAACGSSAGSSDASGTGSAATGDNSAAQAASGDKSNPEPLPVGQPDKK